MRLREGEAANGGAEADGHSQDKKGLGTTLVARYTPRRPEGCPASRGGPSQTGGKSQREMARESERNPRAQRIEKRMPGKRNSGRRGRRGIDCK